MLCYKFDGNFIIFLSYSQKTMHGSLFVDIVYKLLLPLPKRLYFHSGFLRQPWIQGQPWKVLESQKTEKGLELFWKKSKRPWKVWNLSTVKVSTRLDDCMNCRSCCKAGRRTARTVLLINITHQCFKSVCFLE